MGVRYRRMFGITEKMLGTQTGYFIWKPESLKQNVNIIFSDPAGNQTWEWDALDDMISCFNKIVCKVKKCF